MKNALASPLHFHVPIFALLLSTTALPGPAHAQTFSDNTFSNAHWAATVLPYPLSDPTAQCGTSTVPCGQDPAGNPMLSRKTYHNYNGASGNPKAIWVAHLYQPSFYNPSTQGSIVGLTYSYELRQYTASGGQNVTYRLLVFQNFTYYASNTTPPDWIGVNSWQPFNHANLTAGNFVKVSGPPSTPQHPDFSCRGSVIQFGYLTGNSNTNPTISAVDNWTVNIARGNPCPCPRPNQASQPSPRRTVPRR
jgi:hypothetical protein